MTALYLVLKMYSIYVNVNGQWIMARKPIPNLFYSKKDAEKAVNEWFNGYFVNHEWKIDFYIIKR